MSEETSALMKRRMVPPEPAAEVLVRPELMAAIRDAARRADVVLVAAVAGAGKTTAVAHALADRPHLAWLTIGHAHNEPHRLVTHLRWALRRVVPDLPDAVCGHSEVEAAALLAAHVSGRGIVLVLDGVERLAASGPAWKVVQSVVEHGVPGLTVVLVGRCPPPEHCRFPLDARVERLRPGVFDLAPPEVPRLLGRIGVTDADCEKILELSRGWVAAVLGLARGDASRLDRLADHVLADLPPALVDFLECTAVLPEISGPGAGALGLADVQARMSDLERIPVPGVHSLDGRAFACHPVFRDRLETRFRRRPDHDTRPIWTRLARGHLREGRTEEAVTTLLRAGAVGEALPIAEPAIMPVIDRGEFALAEAWLTPLPPYATEPDTFTTARLMLAIARDDFTRAEGIVRRLEDTGTRDTLAARSDRAATMIAWCYLHQGRPDALDEVLAAARSVPLTEAVRYASRMITNSGRDEPLTAPPLSGTPSDALVLIADYTFGRAGALDGKYTTEWVRVVSRAGRIAALRASGRLTEALREHDQALDAGNGNLALRVYIGPELLTDAGLTDRARTAVEEGRALAEATGSVGYRALNAVAAAKFALRLGDDPGAARQVLDAAAHLIHGREFRLISGLLDTWYGVALLRQNVNLAARTRLRQAVRSMRDGHRLLELPTAAVYLAEAEWRLGDETAADQAADLALSTSQTLGSHHQLLRALRDVPEVVSRRIDAIAGTDSPWHALGRALLSPEPTVSAVPTAPATRIDLHDFGPPAMDIDARRVRPRIAKSYELLALLAATRGPAVRRSDVLAALFPDRPARTAATYLRQTTHCLRQVLRDPAVLQVENGLIGFAPGVVVQSAAARFEILLTEARRLSGPERLDALADALSLAERGPYLAGIDSAWAQQRRQQLVDQAAVARFDAAELSFDLGRLRDAATYCDAVLATDKYQEAAWRLRMRIANALGSDSGVLTAYRRCSEALTELDAEPAVSTRALLEFLRR